MKSDIAEAELILSYRTFNTSQSFEQGSDEKQPGSPEIIEEIQTKLVAINREWKVRECSRLLSAPRPGTGYDALIPGLSIHQIAIPIATATLTILIPLVRAWLKRVEGRSISLKLRNDEIVQLQTKGLDIDEVLEILKKAKRRQRQQSASTRKGKRK